MSDQDMYDLNGWTKVTCTESDRLREGLRPLSSLTDPEGTYSAGVVYTEWGTADNEPVLREYRWSAADRDCEHYRADPSPHIAAARAAIRGAASSAGEGL